MNIGDLGSVNLASRVRHDRPVNPPNKHEFTDELKEFKQNILRSVAEEKPVLKSTLTDKYEPGLFNRHDVVHGAERKQFNIASSLKGQVETILDKAAESSTDFRV